MINNKTFHIPIYRITRSTIKPFISQYTELQDEQYNLSYPNIQNYMINNKTFHIPIYRITRSTIKPFISQYTELQDEQ